MGNPYLKMRENLALFMPTHRLISLIFYENIPLAHRNWLIPLIDSVYLKILQVPKLKFAKINKRGCPNKNGGFEKFSKINKRVETTIRDLRVLCKVRFQR